MNAPTLPRFLRPLAPTPYTIATTRLAAGVARRIRAVVDAEHERRRGLREGFTDLGKQWLADGAPVGDAYAAWAAGRREGFVVPLVMAVSFMGER